jgi:hypothetical protein
VIGEPKISRARIARYCARHATKRRRLGRTRRKHVISIGLYQPLRSTCVHLKSECCDRGSENFKSTCLSLLRTRQHNTPPRQRRLCMRLTKAEHDLPHYPKYDAQCLCHPSGTSPAYLGSRTEKDAHTTRLCLQKAECRNSSSCRRDPFVPSSDSAAFSKLNDVQRLCHPSGTSLAHSRSRTEKDAHTKGLCPRRVNVEITSVAVGIHFVTSSDIETFRENCYHVFHLTFRCFRHFPWSHI